MMCYSSFNTDMTKKCSVCRKVFEKKYSTSKKEWKRQRYCSRTCWYTLLPKRMKGNQIARGHSSWNKGKPWSEQHREKLSAIHKKNPNRYWEGKSRPDMWKGPKVGYFTLHKWVYKHLGRPTTCEHCGKSGLTGQHINWANKSGRYLQKLDDWIRLCVTCHRKYDGRTKRK